VYGNQQDFDVPIMGKLLKEGSLTGVTNNGPDTVKNALSAELGGPMDNRFLWDEEDIARAQVVALEARVSQRLSGQGSSSSPASSAQSHASSCSDISASEAAELAARDSPGQYSQGLERITALSKRVTGGSSSHPSSGPGRR
jgi:hypothetical protein